MIDATIYDDQGTVLGCMSGTEEEIAAFTAGRTFIGGFYPRQDYYVLNGQPVRKPPSPGDNFIWSVQDQGWVFDPAVAERNARFKRTNLLKLTDWTQLPDVADTIRQAWGTYRQALRDVSDQSGFPQTIVWPEPPYPLDY